MPSFSKIDILSKTMILGASLSVLVAALGMLGYLPGLAILGRVRENLIPMAPSTAICFLLQGAILLRLAFQPVKSRAITISLMAVAALTALFGFLEVPGHFTGLDLNLEDWIVPEAGRVGDIPIARMSPMTGGLFFLSGTATLLLLLRSYSLKGRPNHIAGILASLTFLASLVALLGYLIGTPLLYGQGATIPIAITTAVGFFWLGVTLIVAAGQDSFPLQLVFGPSTRARLMRAFLPLAIVAVLIDIFDDRVLHPLSSINPALLLAATVVVLMVAIGGVVAAISAGIGGNIDQAREELQESERKYRSLFASANDAIYLVDSQSQKIIDCNAKASELDGYSIEELRGKPVKELHTEEEQELLPDIFKTLPEKGSDQILGLHHLRKDGRLVPIEINTRLIEVEGRPVNFAIIRDLTERLRAEEAVRQKDLDIRKAYADVFSAVTNEKLLILTDKEIQAALGEPCKDPYTVASVEDLAGSRDFLRETLRQCGADEGDLAGLISASGEAVLNSVKHGGGCEVQVYTREEAVQIRVSDHGPGIDFRDLPKATLVPGFSTKKSLGMGFTILLDICDRVLLSTGVEGTTVLLESGGKEDDDALSPFLTMSIQSAGAL